MTIVSNVSVLAIASPLLPIAASCVAMIVPPRSNDLDDDVKARPTSTHRADPPT
jgi:hypothetical protein